MVRPDITSPWLPAVRHLVDVGEIKRIESSRTEVHSRSEFVFYRCMTERVIEYCGMSYDYIDKLSGRSFLSWHVQLK